MPRTLWSGSLSFGLVNVPVQLVSAARDLDYHFHQLHEPDHARIEQRLFCSQDCVAAWLRTTGNERGYVMDLATLWRLATHRYEGRLTRGYTRRDPATAADYLRSIGLTGPFWACDDLRVSGGGRGGGRGR